MNSTQPHVPAAVDVVVVGAGFAGLYTLHRLRELGLSAVCFEAASDVGGVWYWNRYPGARCDIESMQYSFGFSEELQQEWKWSEKFASQPEILRYAQHVADRFDLRRDIVFGTRVVRASYDESAARWAIGTDGGHQVSARFCVMATGLLSAKRIPPFPGLESFGGPIYHTGAWPHQPVDFEGKRVGVIGTGSTAIGLIPEIAKDAQQLVVFQRTPNYSMPARNRPMTVEYERSWKDVYAARRKQAREATKSFTIYEFSQHGAMEVDEAERQRVFTGRWETGGVNFLHSFNDIMLNAESNEAAAEFVRNRIREVVKDPDVAETLSPRGYPIGSKRPCVDTGYFETYNRDNVSLVDLRKTPIVEIDPAGVRTSTGQYDLDILVLATGYDAMTGPLLSIDVTGRGGRSMRDAWAAGPRTYLGLMVHGFPNLFVVTGPGSPSVLANLVTAIEQHVEWITDCVAHLRREGKTAIEANLDAQDAWVDHVNEVADRTLYPVANSWYVGANVPGKPRVFMPYVGGVIAYQAKCAEVAANGYEGFTLTTTQPG